MDRSTPGLPVHHQLLECTQTQIIYNIYLSLSIIYLSIIIYLGFPGGSVIKNLPVNAEDAGDTGSIPGSERSPGGANSDPLQYFLPGKFRGQRSLAGYSPWGRKESDTTDYLHTRHLSTYQHLPVCLSLHPPVYLNVRMTGVQEKPKGLKRTCFLPLARACRPGPARCQPSEKPGCV